MYPKGEARKIKQEFWTAFGKYLSPVLSSEIERINWVNYHTGFKHLYFRLDADNKTASISIEITHPVSEERMMFFERFKQVRTILEDVLTESWKWEEEHKDEDEKRISRISKEITGVNIYDQRTWPAIISFLKPRIIGLDEFWSTARYAFEDLR